jgi:peptidoglycan/LPS O-acetylase OafA/YrhL
MPRPLGYRPALDGVRGLAIALVVVSHATGWPRGGWFGVDLFFVLSGFLITTLLLEERRTVGRVSLARFYGRRALRLLPALGTMLLAYTAVAIAVGSDPSAVARKTLIGASYLTNIVQAWSPSTDVRPLRHLWSLAMEEQFYLLWPALLPLILRFRPRLLIPLLMAGILASWIERITLLAATSPHAVRLYKAPDTHADPLLIGCLLAVLLFSGRITRERITGALMFTGLAIGALLISQFGAHDVGSFVLGIPLFACCASVVITAAATGARSARFLELWPLPQLGRISYALYLWHPLTLFAIGVTRDHRAGGMVRPLLGIFAAVALAIASWFLVERPFLRLKHRLRPAPSSSDRGPGVREHRGARPSPATPS